jgi:hypothetical protein
MEERRTDIYLDWEWAVPVESLISLFMFIDEASPPNGDHTLPRVFSDGTDPGCSKFGSQKNLNMYGYGM